MVSNMHPLFVNLNHFKGLKILKYNAIKLLIDDKWILFKKFVWNAELEGLSAY